uniref:Uncharacterized protein n=1 Tax=Mus musculus TaxID=10090 RepID=Q3UP90_MOUSE|nr:unnamed protein product [Mus musculus]
MGIISPTLCVYCKDESSHTCDGSVCVLSSYSRHHKQFSFDIMLVLNLKSKEVKVKTNVVLKQKKANKRKFRKTKKLSLMSTTTVYPESQVRILENHCAMFHSVSVP